MWSLEASTPACQTSTCGTATAMREPTPDPGQWLRTRQAPDGDGLGAATRPSSRGSSWETTRDASPRPWTRCDGTAVSWSPQRPALRPSDSSRHREPEGGRDGLAGGVDVLRGKGHYGHRSRKTTGWYAVGGALPGSGGGRAQRPVRSRLETTPQPKRWRAIGPCTHPQGESECPVCRWLSVPITAKTTTRKSLLNEKRTP